ncbi:MAG: hypothetical protein ACE5J3_09760, partial [Methanosarcinales archaeon]
MAQANIVLESIKKGIKEIIEKYNNYKKRVGEKGLKDLSEANVRKDYIDPLFEILGWNVRNSDEYDAEQYIRGAGYVDTALKLNLIPKIFVEAKKFGMIKPMEFQT